MANPDTSYILSVTENCKILEDAGKGGVILGLCFVDVSTSKFMIGQVCYSCDL